MKNSFLLIVISGTLFFNDCNHLQNVSSDSKSDIIKIKIINRTTNHYIKKDTLLSDKKDIEDFKKQLKSLKEISNANIQSNFGFYEVKLIYNDGTDEQLGIIYTVFDGLIITNDNTGKKYKNNAMENLMLYYLRK